MLRLAHVSLMMVGLAALAACTDGPPNPLATNGSDNPSFNRDRHNDDDGEGEDNKGGFVRLVSIVGPGHGRFRATRVPHSTVPGNFAVHIEARIRRAKPNTTYLLQRAAEAFTTTPPAGFPMATTIDGSCQRGLAIAPWSTLVPPPVAFVSWTPTLTTDAQGNGETDFVFESTVPLPLFDVMFRVIESGSAPQSVFQTDCTVVPLI